MSPRIGSLFAGYGGLDMAVESVYGGSLAWYSEIDKGALKILTHRYPDVPNVGDVTAVDWSQVEPVDILTGGSPCQDLSHAGKRAGMTEGTRSNLWVAMREAIAQLRPRLVIWENVRGAYSAEAASQPSAPVVTKGRGARARRSVALGGGLLDLPDGRPSLRALGRVLGDLSDLGYDARWHGLRAADVGAPHGRFRVFIVATDANGEGCGGLGRLESFRRDADGRDRADGLGPAPQPPAREDDLTLLGTPTSRDWKDGGPQDVPINGLLGRQVWALLPTPAVNDMGAGKTVEDWDAWTDRMKSEHGNGNGHGKSLAIEAQRLLPTPTTTQRGPDVAAREGRPGAGPNLHNEVAPERWGDYAPAIHRWEQVLGRPAPAPTMTNSKGNPQLAPAFVEWMMGLPADWVTDAPGITRNEALKALGNGVVPQQAAHALRVMASWAEVAA